MPRTAAKVTQADIAYLYVMSDEDGEQHVKVGRSAKPLARRSQLQTGRASKLAIRGQYPVSAEQAHALEAKLKAVLAPLKIKGEVFNATDDLACAITKWIAAGNEPDEFIQVAVAKQLALLEWDRQERRPSASGRWARPETVAAAKKAYDEYKALSARLDEIDIARADETDSFAAKLREPYTAGTRRSAGKPKLGGASG